MKDRKIRKTKEIKTHKCTVSEKPRQEIEKIIMKDTETTDKPEKNKETITVRKYDTSHKAHYHTTNALNQNRCNVEKVVTALRRGEKDSKKQNEDNAEKINKGIKKCRESKNKECKMNGLIISSYTFKVLVKIQRKNAGLLYYGRISHTLGI